ncbi:EVE domain-containing protein [Entomobacter blattae]|uniref:EVE domain protein n=1 Tax=Entomobacter blattae TaxID=2762277 RepID=A0A7H1NTG7_9PROT|nr:EVE domain-containing protein [Entomobacter blattae]QNT79077.1 EVE domain protein [Entomobacter blattae]
MTGKVMNTQRFWLIKSEPDAFSWDEQVQNGIEPWTGIRNYQARNNLKEMKVGDLAFFYHSNIGKEIVGVVKIVRTAYPDPTAEEDSRWVCVDVQTIKSMPQPVTLAQIKNNPKLAQMALIRQSRLSVCPVTSQEWAEILRMGRWQ